MWNRTTSGSDSTAGEAGAITLRIVVRDARGALCAAGASGAANADAPLTPRPASADRSSANKLSIRAALDVALARAFELAFPSAFELAFGAAFEFALGIAFALAFVGAFELTLGCALELALGDPIAG
jgi:hypothetical protein